MGFVKKAKMIILLLIISFIFIRYSLVSYNFVQAKENFNLTTISQKKDEFAQKKSSFFENLENIKNKKFKKIKK